jgi:(4S)-4-hydroxy-5-phosphonooxypentane-2,3-dione isomerase
MIMRIVRMEFEPSRVEEFHGIFDSAKSRIRSFEGCEQLELYRDLDEHNVIYTVSYWRDGEALEQYRHSELFTSIWAKSRELFKGRGAAFSLVWLEKVEPS